MKVTLKNIGVLKFAEFALGDFTVICGGNNTGKTYATYSLYGFLDFWAEAVSFGIPDNMLQALLADGTVRLPLDQFVPKAPRMLATASEHYSKTLPYVFATKEARFAESAFSFRWSMSAAPGPSTRSGSSQDVVSPRRRRYCGHPARPEDRPRRFAEEIGGRQGDRLWPDIPTRFIVRSGGPA